MLDPAWTFVDELQQPLHMTKPAFWQRRAARPGELSLAGGIRLIVDFPDPAGCLATALADFDRFCRCLELGDPTSRDTVCLRIRSGQTDRFEAYRLAVAADGISLEAADTEGIRRGLVFLEELILASGSPALPLALHERRPFLRTRLSRCFFGPIKRPPMNRDELADDVNYYPDEYLNRLAHEGVNALWLTISFRDTIPSRILPGFGRRADVHLPKLRQTVDRCARYGIRVFAFFIEPTAFIDARNHERYLDLARYADSFPELLGHRQGDLTAFCPATELARRFLREMTHTLFTAVPGLGGMIDISVGERMTHCWSLGPSNCLRCSARLPHEVLADVLSCLHAGMHAADPTAEFISWPYSQYLHWGEDKTAEAAGRVPPGVILQHNFESAGLTEQLGKRRRADDYWLSYTGPSDLFRRCARQARADGTPIYAKLQVGCSHGVASVTHVPVPGILYDKYRQMFDLGVSGAMQSWYFGNYPSLMTRAAGRLSFEPFPADQASFLRRLAQADWGPYAGRVVQAWQLFQEAYQQYPVYHVFGYYAPMHDGPVWPLYLWPVNRPLIANWKFMPEYPEQGDRIGECLQDAFTLDEALLLCGRLARTWQAGLHVLDPLEPVFATDRDRLRDINTARALGILFASGANILRFYQLREILADSTGPEARDCLCQMREIVEREIRHSKRLSRCCALDPALGFNSEHEGYRFYPDKLTHRVSQLERLLREDFPALEVRLERGLFPFPVYTGQEPDRAVYRCPSAVLADPAASPKPFDIDWASVAEFGCLKSADQAVTARFWACHDPNWLYLLVRQGGPLRPLTVRFFAERLWPERSYTFDPQTARTSLVVRDPVRPSQWPENLETIILPEQDGETILAMRIAFDELQRPAHCRKRPLRVNVADGEGAWVRREIPAFRLAQSPVHPDEYGWLRFEAESVTHGGERDR
jgi:hypothetical protein